MKPRRLIEAGPEPTGAQLDRATLRRFIAIEMRIEAIEKRMPPPPTPPATGWLTIKQAVEALHRSKPTLYACRPMARSRADSRAALSVWWKT